MMKAVSRLVDCSRTAAVLALCLGCAPLPTPSSPAAAASTDGTQLEQATASTLDPAERDRLLGGGRVSLPMEFDEDGGHYVGGTSYQLVSAAPDEVLDALQDPDTLAEMLPYTLAVREVEPATERRRLEVTQGNDIVQATYTVEIDDSAPDEYRFWLEPSSPHDIDDVWGYIRVHPFNEKKSLITVAVALDVGPGIVRMLFEDRIRDVILATPSRIRDVLERDAGRVTSVPSATDVRVARQP